MRVLAVDSSSSAATIALLRDEKLECEIFVDYKLQHSVILFSMIEKALEMTGVKIEDVDAVAVSGGPGSFTGLRIGVAAAKGIAQGDSKKFIGISSLDAMAFQQVGFQGIICPIMDALRDNVYTALYSWHNGELSRIGDYDAQHIDELLDKLFKMSEDVIFCGDAVGLHRERIIDRLSEKARFAHLSTTMPRAASIAEIAMKRLKEGVCDDIYTYSPVYIRKSQAEREYEKKQGESHE